jgi:hypothetical protein
MSKPISKQSLYSMTSARAKKAIRRLEELMESENESVALGACKTILNKTLPDIKTIEVEKLEAVENKETLSPEVARVIASRLDSAKDDRIEYLERKLKEKNNK